MKVVTAIDSFKGSMTSMEAGFAAAVGIHRVEANAEVQVRPLADGGEGTVEALVAGMNGKTEHVKVTGPLGEPVICEYGIIESTKTAVIEMAGAAGITQVPDEKRNPLYTTTYGVGEVIKDAIEKGCRRFIVGIGGSATNDGGVGMLQALGYAFLDKDGKQVLPGARGLKDIAEITDAYVIPELAECKFRVACDVTNPLCGELGCSAIYGPQKGATPEMIKDMDQWLGAYAELAKDRFPKADPKYPGTGAAGGMGFAFLTFTDAVLESGINIVLDETKLEEYIKDADLVITGEGRMDGQTAMGKAPVGVAKLAKNDFKTRYAGSYLGIVWAFIQPVITILVYWFVFSVGFRSGTGDLGVPFVLYLVAGIVPWFFFQDALIGGTNSLLEYNYLVKKVVFNISVLPVVKIISAMFVHAFFVLFTIILYAAYGKFPDFYYLQIIYYSVCVFILVLGLSYATSAIVIFFRDLTQIINIVLQVGVWLTPIMWIVEASPLMGHPVIMKILKLNPMYYIVSGYRDTFLMKTWFWEHAGWTVYFWIFTILCFLFGSWVFKRLRIHFADVL